MKRAVNPGVPAGALRELFKGEGGSMNGGEQVKKGKKTAKNL